MIKLGVCTGLENAQKCAEIGFDYIELSMSAVAALPQEGFAPRTPPCPFTP